MIDTGIPVSSLLGCRLVLLRRTVSLRTDLACHGKA